METRRAGGGRGPGRHRARRRRHGRPSTPAAAPPTWRSRWRGSAGRCGSPPRAPTTHGGVLAEPASRATASCWPATRGAVERTSTAAATIGADGAASLRLRPRVAAQPAAAGRGAAGRGAHLLARRGARAGRRPRAGADGRGLRQHATVSYDVNARPAITGTGPEVVALVERMVAVSDVVKASDEDLRRRSTRTSTSLSRGPAPARPRPGGGRRHPGRRRGDLGRPRTATVEVAPVPVEVADTIGAGDTFGAAVIDALWERGRFGADRRRPPRAAGRGDRRGARPRRPRGRRHRVAARRGPAVPLGALSHPAAQPGAGAS